MSKETREGVVNLHFRMTKEDHKKLKCLCAEKGISMQDAIECKIVELLRDGFFPSSKTIQKVP